MDFDFVRGSDFSAEGENGKILTSIDGYKSSLLILDERTRYHWVFLTKTKSPPIDILNVFLTAHGIKEGNRTIRIDQGGKLVTSAYFRAKALECDYLVETTGSDASFQNAKAERSHHTSSQMMICQLSAAGLSSACWSCALLYS